MEKDTEAQAMSDNGDSNDDYDDEFSDEGYDSDGYPPDDC